MEYENRKKNKDGGYGWVVVFAFFMSSIIIDALRYANGLLYIEFLTEFNRGKGETAWIGSLMICVYNILGPVIAMAINRFGIRVTCVAGSVIATLGLIASSFTRSLHVLFLTYGIIQGIGLGMMYLGGWVAVSWYFENKRGMALGIAQCGCGVGAFAISPVLKLLIDHYTWRGAVLFLAGLCLNGCVLSMFYRPFEENYDILEITKDENGIPSKKLLDNSEKSSLSIVIGSRQSINRGFISNKFNMDKSPEKKNSKSERLKHFVGLKDDPKPRTFAELREQQLQGYTLKTHRSHLSSLTWLSTRSINSINYTPSVLGSDASLETIMAKRRRKRLMDATSLNGVQNSIPVTKEVEEQKQVQFSIGIIERLFPKFLITDIRLVLMMISAVFYCMATFIPISLIADYGRIVGCSEDIVGWFVSAIGIGGTVGRVICGVVVDIQWVNRQWFLTGMILMCAVSTLLVPLMETTAPLLIYSFIYGIGIGSLYVVPPVILMEMFGEDRIPQVMGVFMYTAGVSCIVGAPIAGWLFDASGSYTMSFLFCGGIYVLSFCCNFLVICFTSKDKNSEDNIITNQQIPSSKSNHTIYISPPNDGVSLTSHEAAEPEIAAEPDPEAQSLTASQREED